MQKFLGPIVKALIWIALAVQANRILKKKGKTPSKDLDPPGML